ncbi:hypothetical protein SASPL_105336 [Salvia splendens]|uniref:Protein LURP-one-related 15 n=1 Tax=Salvia splendens TaxID=180675 RepID=A0A8X9AAM5_SALSN|nr:hypothetical protein SASPL_105336 [Salvia splendens]
MTTQQSTAYNEVAVIDRKFCLPRSIDLTISKNIWQIGQANFVVTKSNGEIIFKIKGAIFSFNTTRVVYNAAGVPIVTLRKKTFSILSTWQVFRGEGKDQKDLIFSVRRSSFFQMKTKLSVFVAENSDVCDYTVQADWFQRFCQVYVGDSPYKKLAQVEKNLSVGSLISGGDRFKVKVYPNVDCAFIVTLIVVLDEIISQAKRSSNNKKRR